MIRREISIDCDGDDKRIIKHADMRLYELKSSIFGISYGKPRFQAIHIPSGKMNKMVWYATKHPGWALAHCISEVLTNEIRCPLPSE